MRATGQLVGARTAESARPAFVQRGLRYWLLCFAALALLWSAPSFASENTNTQTIVTNLGPSPVEVFRRLLTLDSRSRAKDLDIYPPELREPIEKKVQEYIALPADEREVRLQATELRHYLTLLLPLPHTNRALLVKQIPEPMRTVVQARLDTWAIMPPDMQEEMLDSERAMNYFAQLGKMTAAQRQALFKDMRPEQRAKLDADIARWRKLPPATRNRSLAQLNELFTLTAEEREKAIRHLSDDERDSMRVTLDRFEDLTPEQRKICIRSFQKFANMSLDERQEFLKKAEAWQRMTPAEREQWREVVRRVPELPPLPPGFFPAIAIVAPEPVKTNAPAGTGRTNGS